MEFGDWLPSEGTLSITNLFRVVRRRLWSTPGRAHVELPDLEGEEFTDFVDTLTAELESLDGVVWAAANGATHRLVVQWEEHRIGLEAILDAVDTVEQRFHLGETSYGADRSDHPGDDEPLVRCFARIGADIAGAGIGLFRSVFRRRAGPGRIDLAALLSIVNNVPHLRRALGKRFGKSTARTGIGLTNPVVQGMGAGPIGPVVSLTHQFCQWREIAHRRSSWRRREAALCDEPQKASSPAATAGKRPAPIPDGPIETYAEDAWEMSLGGFLVGLADTQQLDRAVTPLLDALPKPARYGRDSFCCALGAEFAKRDVVIMNPDALRCLDRINCVVVDRALLAEEPSSEPATQALIDAIRKVDLELIVAARDRDRASVFQPDQIVEADRRLLRSIRDFQRDDRVVALLFDGHHPALAAADFAMGFATDDDLPWGADVIAGDDLDDATFAVEAMGVARTVAHRSTLLAGAGTGIGAFSAIRGLRKTRPGRVRLAVNAASLMALIYGTVRGRKLAREIQPSPPAPTAWHEMDKAAVMERVETTPDGLTDAEADNRREPAPAPPSTLRRFGDAVVEELANPLTPVLAAGAAVSAVVGSAVDAGIVATVIGINGLIGGAERYNAEVAIEKMTGRKTDGTTVRRHGSLRTVDTEDLVVGDVLHLEAGDVVPADCRILTCDRLEVDESSLTGESLPVTKGSAPSFAALPGDRTSMLYAGSSIAVGCAEAVVVATGADTEARRGFALAEGAAPRATGVQARLTGLTEKSIPLANLSGGAVMTLGVLRRQELKTLVGPAVGLAIGAIPEGLPLLATTAQLAASRRLSDRQVVVNNPRAMEALGRTDVLCVDKTGTLTQGTLTLHGIYDGDVAVGPPDWTDSHLDVLARALRATPPAPEHGELVHTTDQALVDGAAEADVDAGNWRPKRELPFKAGQPFHAVVGELEDQIRLAVKGAPEAVLSRCSHQRKDGDPSSIDDPRRRQLLEISRDLAGQGLRVLAVAGRHVQHLDDRELNHEDVTDLTFAGFVTLSDPLRPTAAQAVEALEAAGVTVVMLTGDHLQTARRVARDVGLVHKNGVLSGRELEELDDDELAVCLSEISVVARTTPAHKVRLVEAFQDRDHVVAMTGDGANDAAAIRLADVGIALGDDSSDAARDAADLVVADARIDTIVDAVVEGRAMWRSVRDAVSVLLGGNLGEVGFMVTSGTASPRPALNARQLLLVNLFTDVAPSLAIALRPPPEVSPRELLHEGPEASLGEALERDIIWRAAITTGGSFGSWFVARHTFQKKRAPTIGLLSLVASQLGQTLTTAKPTAPVFIASFGSLAALLALIETPGISHLLGCRPLGPVGLTTAFGGAAAATALSLVIPRLPRWRDRLHEFVPERPEPSPRQFFDEYYAGVSAR